MKRYFVVLFLTIFIIFCASWASLTRYKGSNETKRVLADATAEITQDITIGALPTATPTTTPTSTSAATATPTSTSVSQATASPTAIPLPSPSASPSIMQIPDKLTIYGYAPSNSDVTLTGIAVSEQVRAQKNGYFEFKRLFFPTHLSFAAGKLYPELCLYAIDDMARLTYPTCIPSLPLDSGAKRIGPIILSPTLTIGNDNIPQNKQVRASGKTIPNTKVEIYFARAGTGTNFFSIIKEALAYFIPKYEVVSDSEGYFEFNLPSDSSDVWRIFAVSRPPEGDSPKSNTLNFNVISKYFFWMNAFIWLIGLIRSNWLYFVILIQLLVVMLLLHGLRKTRVYKTKKTNKPTRKLLKSSEE